MSKRVGIRLMGNPTGNRVVTCADVLACLEGDYSTWAIYDSFADSGVSGGKGRQGALVNRLETEILLADAYALEAKRYTIATKTLTALTGTDHDFPGWFTTPNYMRGYSVLGTYTVALIYNKDGIRIYKNGAIIASFTSTELGMNNGTVYTVDISSSGKYVVVSGWITALAGRGWVVLVGS